MARGRRRERKPDVFTVDPRLLQPSTVEDWVQPSEADNLDEAGALAEQRWRGAYELVGQASGVEEVPVTSDRAAALAMRDGGPEVEPTSVAFVKTAELAGTAALRANPWAVVGHGMPFRDEATLAAHHWSAHR